MTGTNQTLLYNQPPCANSASANTHTHPHTYTSTGLCITVLRPGVTLWTQEGRKYKAALFPTPLCINGRFSHEHWRSRRNYQKSHSTIREPVGTREKHWHLTKPRTGPEHGHVKSLACFLLSPVGTVEEAVLASGGAVVLHDLDITSDSAVLQHCKKPRQKMVTGYFSTGKSKLHRT